MHDLPAWFPKKRTMVWCLAFLGLILLYLDVWNWNQAEPLLFGLPYWVWYIFLLCLLTFLLFYVFVRQYWRNEP
jgi:hypothetical protein